MSKKELIEKSIFIITEYYKGNMDPLFNALAQNVLWIGPRSGQMIKGKDVMIQTWNAAEKTSWFTMSGISAESISTGRNNLEVLLEYYVYTHFPDGITDQHHQRIHFSWGDTVHPDQAGIFMIHISNIADGEKFDGKVYASSPEESAIDSMKMHVPDQSEKIIPISGLNDLTYFLRPSSILWIESTDNARHSIIHTPEGTCLSTESTRVLEKKCEGYLLRCHASYLVNPLYVYSLTRFTVTMDDGTALPVPEKKYTAFKKALKDWNYVQPK